MFVAYHKVHHFTQHVELHASVALTTANPQIHPSVCLSVMRWHPD